MERKIQWCGGLFSEPSGTRTRDPVIKSQQGGLTKGYSRLRPGTLTCGPRWHSAIPPPLSDTSDYLPLPSIPSILRLF